MCRFNYILCFIVLIACKNDKPSLIRYEEGKQFLTANTMSNDGKRIDSPKIEKVCRDSVALGNELLVKIFLGDSKFHIVNAFVDCKEEAISKVDTATLKVEGCSQQLVVESDTVFIAFNPSEVGVHTFPEVMILTQDTERVFRTYSYSFEYKVFKE